MLKFLRYWKLKRDVRKTTRLIMVGCLDYSARLIEEYPHISQTDIARRLLIQKALSWDCVNDAQFVHKSTGLSLLLDGNTDVGAVIFQIYQTELTPALNVFSEKPREQLWTTAREEAWRVQLEFMDLWTKLSNQPTS